MSYIVNDKPSAVKVEEQPNIVTLESARFKIQGTDIEVVIDKSDVEKLSSYWIWEDLATSNLISKLIIQELTKNNKL